MARRDKSTQWIGIETEIDTGAELSHTETGRSRVSTSSNKNNDIKSRGRSKNQNARKQSTARKQ
eukprot:11159304-Lingulodinium_polyedra.AAC.1